MNSHFCLPTERCTSGIMLQMPHTPHELNTTQTGAYRRQKLFPRIPVEACRSKFQQFAQVVPSHGSGAADVTDSVTQWKPQQGFGPQLTDLTGICTAFLGRYGVVQVYLWLESCLLAPCRFRWSNATCNPWSGRPLCLEQLEPCASRILGRLRMGGRLPPSQRNCPGPTLVFCLLIRPSIGRVQLFVRNRYFSPPTRLKQYYEECQAQVRAETQVRPQH